MYTGPSFTRDLLPALDLRTFESIDNDGADHRRVVITVSRSIPTAFVAASIDAFNAGLADASQGVALVPYDGADIVTFAKSQSLEQHSFYAPFEAKGDGYSAWSADGDMSKRLANELAVDMCGAQERVEGKRAPQVGGVIRATFAAFCFNNHMGGAQKKKEDAVPSSPRKRRSAEKAGCPPTKQRRANAEKVYSPLAASYAMLLHETHKDAMQAKNHTIKLLESMLAAKNKADP